jgi:predicted metal-dependent peptidase
MNKDVADQLTRARTGLIIDQPFYGMLALRLKMVEDVNIPTAAVDGEHMYYNPAFIDSLPIGQKKTLIAHEVMHCVYDHMRRRGDRNHRKFNKAGDYVINLVLEESGFEPIPIWLFNKAYKDMTTDHVYSLLPDDDGSGKGPLDDCMDADPSADPDGMAEVEWKIATIQAAKLAQQEGKLPGALARFVDELTNNKVDWKALLRRFITETSKDDYSWSRFNRRFQAQGIFLPSLYSESMGEMVVVIDTSGSIDQPTLNAFGSEIKAIVASSRPAKLNVIYCDSQVNHVDEFGPNDELLFKMHGGGGTSFRPPFIWVDNNNVKPVCLVYLTDLYGDFGNAPDYPVMWVCTTSQVAPWGETLPIEI